MPAGLLAERLETAICMSEFFSPNPLHHLKTPRCQVQGVPAYGGVFPWRGHLTGSPYPPFHHLHMQRSRGEIQGGKAHIPRRHAHLVIRPDMAIQHKGYIPEGDC